MMYYWIAGIYFDGAQKFLFRRRPVPGISEIIDRHCGMGFSQRWVKLDGLQRRPVDYLKSRFRRDVAVERQSVVSFRNGGLRQSEARVSLDRLLKIRYPFLEAIAGPFAPVKTPLKVA